MSRGRKPKPAEIHLINGNPSHLKRDALEIAAAEADGLEIAPPGELCGESLAEWRRLMPIMRGMRTLSSQELHVLAAYCMAWGRLLEAQRQLNAIGPDNWVTQDEKGVQRKTPWIDIADKSSATMLRIAVEFGLTPSARMRIKPTIEKNVNAEEKKVARFFAA